MQLSEWLRLNSIAVNAIGNEWGLDPAHLGRRLKGEIPPTFELIVRAHIVSAGAVSIEDWIDLNRPALEEKGIRLQPAKEKA